MNCMDAMFHQGVLDQRNSLGCVASSYIVLATSILIVLVISVKFLAALQVNRTGVPTTPERFVLCAVPCYNENMESLRKTFK